MKQTKGGGMRGMSEKREYRKHAARLLTIGSQLEFRLDTTLSQYPNGVLMGGSNEVEKAFFFHHEKLPLTFLL